MICRYTSFSCRAREGCEAGALGEPLHAEDLLGMAGGVATGTRSGSTLLEAFMGGRSEGTPSHSCVRESPSFPPGHIQAPRQLPSALLPPSSHLAQTCPLPGTSSLHSPPPPGAAGHILACQASAGSRCRGGQAAGTVRRALGQARRGVVSPAMMGTTEASSGSRARIGGAPGAYTLQEG